MSLFDEPHFEVTDRNQEGSVLVGTVNYNGTPCKVFRFLKWESDMLVADGKWYLIDDASGEPVTSFYHLPEGTQPI